MHPLAGAVGGPGLHVELDIRRFDMIAGAQEAGGEAGGHRHRPGAEHRVFERDARLIPQAAHLVVERRLVAFEHQPRLQMVLHVAPHAGQVAQHLDAVLGQMRGLAQPREHHQVRRADGARGQDHLAARADHMLHPARSRYATPVARVPSKVMRLACARVRMVRFSRPRTGLRKATAAEQRRPLRVVSWK